MGNNSSSKNKYEKAYRQGYEQAKNSDPLSQIAHRIGDGLFGGLHKMRSEKSREAGYHDYWRDYHSGKVKRDNSSKAHPQNTGRSRKGERRDRVYVPGSGYSSDSSSSASDTIIGTIIAIPCLLVIGVIALVAILFISMIVQDVYLKDKGKQKQSSSHSSYQRGTGWEVNTRQLNVRSGPGSNYSVVETLPKGSRLTVISDDKNTGAASWVKVVTPSGEEGWANIKYLSISSQMQVRELPKKQEAASPEQSKTSEQSAPPGKVAYPELGPMTPPQPSVSTDFEDVKNPKPPRRVCQEQIDRNNVGPECIWYKKELEALTK